ncbi:replicative DNA helicase [Paenibacillus taichungensis]|uniref:replicative DNA helicase n=2 Tax=Bacteria TaxID=2 RepID=UPI002DBFF1A6|nr:replicative DNA helicase [Paenibacillus taichungensis]MEC0107252.1 replicative DNA helicase [Paenibacillus taichungensis]MEC0194816.1 replicative DNA helicase [Paenibacillus taichungensis]
MNKNELELPHSLEAEQSVLGAILIDSNAFLNVADTLSVEHFYANQHGVTYSAMRELSEEGKNIDLVSLTAKLQDNRQLDTAGGVSYLARMSKSVPTAANITHYAEIMHDRYLHRTTILSLEEQLRNAWKSDNGMMALASVQSAATNLSDKAVKGKEFRTAREVFLSAFDIMEERYANSGDEVTGIRSGYVDLDRMTSGFQNSDLIIVAARPSVGKTAFALNIAQFVALKGQKRVAVFSLEMSAEQLALRMISAEGNIEANRIRTGFLTGDDWDKATNVIASLGESHLFIDDSAALTAQGIINKCRRLKQKFGLDMVVIDYLQLISGEKGKENRQQEVTDISRKLKQLARELHIPVIALSQLNRAVEQRQDKRPMMSDLRESGAIEQDADIVAFLHREDYYDAETEKKNIIEIIIAKQRNGPVGTVELVFMKDYNKFANYERMQTPRLNNDQQAVPDMYRQG